MKKPHWMFIEDENRFVTVSIVLFPIEGESKNEIKKKKKKKKKKKNKKKKKKR